MILLLFLIGLAQAAWPDSYPQRIAMMEAFRLQFATPDIPVDSTDVEQKYSRACDLGFSLACKASRWGPEVTNPIAEASAVFGPQCRSSKSPLACVLVSFELGTVDGVFSNEASNPVKARKLLEQSCEEKLYAPACSYLGYMLLNGIGGGGDLETGMSRLEEGCKAEDAWGCFQIGLRYLETDRTRAEQQLAIACQAGIMSSCLAFADSLSQHADTNEEWSQIAPYLERSCQWGNQGHCLILAGMNMQGRGVAHRPMVGLTLYESACGADLVAGCNGAAEYYVQTGSTKKAAQRFKQACQLDDSKSCAKYGLQLLQGAEGSSGVSEGLIFLKRSCDDGVMPGCLGLAEAYESGMGVDAEPEKALNYAEKACAGQLGKGCTLQARIQESLSLWGQGDASELYAQGCALGDGRGCAVVALKNLATAGFNTEIKNALSKGCDNDDMESCRVLGEHVLNQKPNIGQEMLKKACFGGDDKGCAIAAEFLILQGDEHISEAATLLSEACHRGDSSSCDILRPIAFSADFRKLTESAFLSALCQVWSVDERNPEDNHLLVEVSGGQFKVYIGEHRNRDILAEHSKNEIIQQGTSQVGRSFWGLSGQSFEQTEVHPWGEALPSEASSTEDGVIWGTNAQSANTIWSQQSDWEQSVIHEEKWSSTATGSFRQAVDGYALLHGPVGSVRFERKAETIKVESGCGFTVPRKMLYTEHCSDIQALLAGTLLQRCEGD